MYYDMYEIGKRIKELRLKRKKAYNNGKNPDTKKYYFCQTQQFFADVLGVDRRTIIKWENGDSLPSIEKLDSICELLDCNIEYFLGANEFPYIDTVAKASHFTGIRPEIIDEAQKNPDYLDCINFFMMPENCASLCNEITITNWKKIWIDSTLEKIKSPLYNILLRAFNDFYLSNALEDISVENFKCYIKTYLPEDKLNYTEKGNNNSIIYIKDCLSLDLLLKFLAISQENETLSKYDIFIDFLCSNTYTALMNSIYIELHKNKISNKFIELLTKYLNEI